MKGLVLAPIVLVVLGIFLLFGGDSVANAEEGVANSIGNLASNKWFAGALVVAGGLWVYSATGHFKKITA